MRAASRYIEPTLAAEEESTQPQRHEQQAARALGLRETPVLGEEAEVATDVLGEEPAAVRRAPDVDDLGAGLEQHTPAGLARKR